MKKTLLTVILAAFMFGCSSDDDNNSPACAEKIWGIGSGSAPGEPTQYWIQHGPTSQNSTLTFITQEQHAWFVENTTPPHTCWEGIPDEIAN